MTVTQNQSEPTHDRRAGDGESRGVYRTAVDLVDGGSTFFHQLFWALMLIGGAALWLVSGVVLMLRVLGYL